jgi:hypothetical protein
MANQVGAEMRHSERQGPPLPKVSGNLSPPRKVLGPDASVSDERKEGAGRKEIGGKGAGKRMRRTTWDLKSLDGNGRPAKELKKENG